MTRTTLVLMEKHDEHDLKHTAGGLEGLCFTCVLLQGGWCALKCY